MNKLIEDDKHNFQNNLSSQTHLSQICLVVMKSILRYISFDLQIGRWERWLNCLLLVMDDNTN